VLSLVPAGLSVRLEGRLTPAVAAAELRRVAAEFGWELPAPGVVETDCHVKAALTTPPLRGLMPFRLRGPVTIWLAVVDAAGIEQRDRR
jgi:hypothetical protein